MKKNISSAIFLLDQKMNVMEFIRRIRAIALYFNELSENETRALKHWIKNTTETPLSEIAIDILEAGKKDVELMVANNAFLLRDMRDQAKNEGREEGIKEGRQEGRQEGIKEGRQEGIKEGRQEGIKEGRQEGIKQGIKQGVNQGVTKGKIELIIKLLTKKIGILSDEIINKIRNSDINKLDDIAMDIFDIETISDLENYLKY